MDLEIVKFDDYVLPNQSLEEGDIDANYFQHIPYLNKEIKEKGYDFVNAGAVHIEPMGLYSKKVKDVSELKDGATVNQVRSDNIKVIDKRGCPLFYRPGQVVDSLTQFLASFYGISSIIIDF
ncbi:MetQ/NlpA family ABC transporter substrate-binding protein [Listeria innocua]